MSSARYLAMTAGVIFPEALLAGSIVMLIAFISGIVLIIMNHGLIGGLCVGIAAGMAPGMSAGILSATHHRR